MTVNYDPYIGTGQFVPGSYLSNADPHIDSSSKYLPQLSSVTPSHLWPLRSIQTNPGYTYVDSESQRAVNGDPYYFGDENIVTISKNTDPKYWVGFNQTLERMPLFDLCTQVSYWSSNSNNDVIIVQHQLVYVSKDTLYSPVISLLIDPSLRDCANDGGHRKIQRIDTDGLQGFYYYSTCNLQYPKPITSCYFLQGMLDKNDAENGITKFEYISPLDFLSSAKHDIGE